MNNPHGIINQNSINRKNDYLFRISLKGLFRNDKGEVLVVKETGRTWWDLPGGGMDHGESIYNALKREMYEEVGIIGDFTYTPIAVDEPGFLEHANLWQVRMIFEIKSGDLMFNIGEDGDEMRFIDPDVFKASSQHAEQRIYEYVQRLA